MRECVCLDGVGSKKGKRKKKSGPFFFFLLVSSPCEKQKERGGGSCARVLGVVEVVAVCVRAGRSPVRGLTMSRAIWIEDAGGGVFTPCSACVEGITPGEGRVVVGWWVCGSERTGQGGRLEDCVFDLTFLAAFLETPPSPASSSAPVLSTLDVVGVSGDVGASAAACSDMITGVCALCRSGDRGGVCDGRECRDCARKAERHHHSLFIAKRMVSVIISSRARA